MKRIAYVALVLLALALPASGEERLTLTVRETAGIRRFGYPVYAKLTLPREAQGQTKAADEAAAKALSLNADDLVKHRLTALLLRERGMLRWAEKFGDVGTVLEGVTDDLVPVVMLDLLRRFTDKAQAAEAQRRARR